MANSLKKFIKNLQVFTQLIDWLRNMKDTMHVFHAMINSQTTLLKISRAAEYVFALSTCYVFICYPHNRQSEVFRQEQFLTNIHENICWIDFACVLRSSQRFPFVTAENLYSIHTSKTRIRLVILDLVERKSETENLNFLIGFK